MVRVMAGDAAAGDVAQGIELRLHRMDHQRREDLFEHVAVFLEHQPEELACVMGHKVHFQTADDLLVRQRLVSHLQPHELVRRQ